MLKHFLEMESQKEILYEARQRFDKYLQKYEEIIKNIEYLDEKSNNMQIKNIISDPKLISRNFNDEKENTYGVKVHLPNPEECDNTLSESDIDITGSASTIEFPEYKIKCNNNNKNKIFRENICINIINVQVNGAKKTAKKPKPVKVIQKGNFFQII